VTGYVVSAVTDGSRLNVGTGENTAGKVRMCCVYSGINDGDDDAGTLAVPVRLCNVEEIQVPLSVANAVRPCRGRGNAT
jgi:hypothetical protein